MSLFTGLEMESAAENKGKLQLLYLQISSRYCNNHQNIAGELTVQFLLLNVVISRRSAGEKNSVISLCSNEMA